VARYSGFRNKSDFSVDNDPISSHHPATLEDELNSAEARMRPLLLPILLLSTSLAFAQNGAKAVAAKALQAQPLPCGNNAKTGPACHKNYAAGCALPKDPNHKGKFGPPDLSYAPRYDAYLAYFKNQIPTVLPKSQGTLTEVDFVSKYRSALKATPKITMSNHKAVSAQMLALGEGQYYTVAGYLYYEKLSSGGESCNCDIQKSDPGDDYHIGIGFDENLAATAEQIKNNEKDPNFGELTKGSIVVEMTPHYRAKYHNGKWTQAKLDRALGYQVKVVGQLLLDNDHMGGDAVCSASNASSNCWRISPWELHPVTEFYVCSNKKDCDANASNGWTALDDFQQ
jgi:hypothetical protein